MELLLGDLEEGQAQLAAKKEAKDKAVGLGDVPSPRKPQTEITRRALPAHLPRERVEHTPACSCPNCGGVRLRQIGTDEREVLEYVSSHFKVTRYTTDGRLEICNNVVERAIRPLTLGRKNWLFVGSDTGGGRPSCTPLSSPPS